MSSLLKRHSTLLAFTLSIAASTAFVACGDDDGDGPKPGDDGGSGGSSSGGKTGSGGAATGGKTGSGGVGGAGGGPGSGGKMNPPDVDVPDVTSSGDAASDAAED